MEKSPMTLANRTEVEVVFRTFRAKRRSLRTGIPWADTLRTKKARRRPIRVRAANAIEWRMAPLGRRSVANTANTLATAPGWRVP